MIKWTWKKLRVPGCCQRFSVLQQHIRSSWLRFQATITVDCNIFTGCTKVITAPVFIFSSSPNGWGSSWKFHYGKELFIFTRGGRKINNFFLYCTACYRLALGGKLNIILKNESNEKLRVWLKITDLILMA